MEKAYLIDLQQKLFCFQTWLAREIHEEDFEHPEVEEVQNTINIIDEYI